MERVLHGGRGMAKNINDFHKAYNNIHSSKIEHEEIELPLDCDDKIKIDKLKI